MAVNTLTYKPWWTHNAFVLETINRVEKLIKRKTPRPGMLLSLGLALIGWSMPLSMLLGLIPATLLVSFIGLGLAAAGSVLLIIYLGEI